MSVAAQHLNACRALLSMPSREAALWEKLKHKQRAALLMMADLPLIWRFRRWASFSQSERRQLLNAALEAGSWVNLMQAPE